VTAARTLPSSDELRETFRDFFNSTLEFIERAEREPKELKFAAVHAHVALEIFLKYLYTEKGELEKIQKRKDDRPIPEYVDHAQILNLYYSERRWSYLAKREMQLIMDARNAILHRAQQTGWNVELAECIVRILFFIHSASAGDLDEPLFAQRIGSVAALARNPVWRNAAIAFTSEVCGNYSSAVNCLSCDQRTLIPADLFSLAGADTPDHLVCLNCFEALNTAEEAAVIDCHECGQRSYFIDAYNEQQSQRHVAKCSECGANTWVCRCKECERFFHPSLEEVIRVAGRFCSEACADSYTEE